MGSWRCTVNAGTCVQSEEIRMNCRHMCLRARVCEEPMTLRTCTGTEQQVNEAANRMAGKCHHQNEIHTNTQTNGKQSSSFFLISKWKKN